ncbi:MAG: ATP synthase F1 subunit gamma [Patescibacteria group bacterium]
MESLQQIQARRKSVRNIGTITKAMELVAATKMRRSQTIAVASRPYAATALELLKRLRREELSYTSPLLEARAIKNRLVVLVTSDKGLAGAFNSNVLKSFENFLKDNDVLKMSFISVGLRSHDYMSRNNLPEAATFAHYGDYTTVSEIAPLSQLILDGYLTHQWDEVVIFSTHFINALKQKVLEQKILPIDLKSLEKTIEEILPTHGRFSPETVRVKQTEKAQEYLIEPSAETVLEQLLPHILTMQIYHIMLEANASEHSARRLAMQSASDNASELNDELTLIYNKSRQATITREIIEISSGAESLKIQN